MLFRIPLLILNQLVPFWILKTLTENWPIYTIFKREFKDVRDFPGKEENIN